MDKINIDALFPAKNKTEHKYGSLDINTLINPLAIQNKFSVDKLIQTKKDKRKRVLDAYYKVYKSCLNKINFTDKSGLTYFIFDIPAVMLGCADFNSDECLDFVEHKIKKLHIDILKLSSLKLYVSWTSIESNVNASKGVKSA
jgi:hypothetical protein